LLSASETRSAAAAGSGVETYTDEGAEADGWVVLGKTGPEGDDSGDAFVAADVGEFDFCYGRAGGAGGCAGGGVEAWELVSVWDE
jgi:hypothetical protein